MTQDEIIRIAREVWGERAVLPFNDLERFAALVAEPWIETNKALAKEIIEMKKQAEQEPFDMDDHPPHHLCECRKCMEYFTPLPDCDAFAASGKPIAEQEPMYISESCAERGCACYYSVEVDGEPVAVYSAPVRTKDLTDDDINKISNTIANAMPANMTVEDWKISFARAVIAKLREKERLK